MVQSCLVRQSSGSPELLHSYLLYTLHVMSPKVATEVSVRNSSFTFIGAPLSLSDYDSYYGGLRSFPNVQLSAILLLRSASSPSSRYGSIDVVNCTFTGHTGSNGGAVSLPEASTPPPSVGSPASNPTVPVVNISRCAFSSNSAYFKGGALYIGSSVQLALSDCSFVGNQIVNNDPYYHRVRKTFGYKGGAVSGWDKRSGGLGWHHYNTG